jgi:hypothetical protein
MSSISTGYVALYADDSDSEDDLDPGGKSLAFCKFRFFLANLPAI